MAGEAARGDLDRVRDLVGSTSTSSAAGATPSTGVLLVDGPGRVSA